VVRKAGVTGCGKVFRHSPQIVADNGLINSLYEQIKDPDPSVLTFTLQTLNIVLKAEGGVVINDNMAKYLVLRLDKLPDMELCFVLDYLLTYHCKRKTSNEESRMIVLNALEPYFDSKNGPVFLSAASLFYATAEQTADDDSTLIADFLKRVRPQLAKFLKSSSQPAVQEFQSQLLDFVLDLNPEAAGLLGEAVGKEFQLKSKDLVMLKRRKLKVMLHVCGKGGDPRRNFSHYLLEQIRCQVDVRKDIFESVCSVMRSWPSETKFVLCELNQIVLEDERTFSPLVLNGAKMIPAMANDENLIAMLSRVCALEISSTLTPKVASSLLWILSHFSPKMSDAPYLLEYLVEDHCDLFACQADLLSQCLFAGVRVFASHPAATQHTLGRLFEVCRQKGGPELEKRVIFYAKMLSNSVVSKQVLFPM
jgi:hypothetical protein